MVWQRIIRRFNNHSTTDSRRSRKRRLRLESMERRELLASDLGAIAGSAFVDQNNDGSSTGDPAIFVLGKLKGFGEGIVEGQQIGVIANWNWRHRTSIAAAMFGLEVNLSIAWIYASQIYTAAGQDNLFPFKRGGKGSLRTDSI